MSWNLERKLKQVIKVLEPHKKKVRKDKTKTATDKNVKKGANVNTAAASNAQSYFSKKMVRNMTAIADQSVRMKVM